MLSLKTLFINNTRGENAMNISKSLYLDYVNCRRKLFLSIFTPEKGIIDDSVQRRIDQGHLVGELAYTLFETPAKVSYNNDFEQMVKDTKDLIDKGEKIIAEASFRYKNLLCSFDFLEIIDGGCNIYEVKSSTKVKDIHLHDLAFQYYVAKAYGLKIDQVNLIYVNNDFVLEDEIDPKDFFIIEDLTAKIIAMVDNVKKNLVEISRLEKDPGFMYLSHCGECEYHDHCYDEVPEDSLLYLYNYRRKAQYYSQGIRTLEEIALHDPSLNEIQLRQIDYHYHDYVPYVNQVALENFLDKWVFPLHFLDFETLDFVIPRFKGTHPNQRLPYQASLHVLSSAKSEPVHYDILLEPSEDPREKMIAFLETNINDNGSVIVYNAAFERSILRELADQFPVHGIKLEKIIERIVDLLDPFRQGMVYNKEMKGSFSIKRVYPAVCPEKAEAYHELEAVHNGTEAMAALESLENLNNEDREKMKRNLKNTASWTLCRW